MKTERILRPPKSKRLKSGRVVLEPGEEIGWHVTEKREELIIVVKGEATVMENNSEKKKVKEKETYYVEEGVKHNVKNESNGKVEYVYVVSLFQD